MGIPVYPGPLQSSSSSIGAVVSDQPVVSTLNTLDGATTSNMALVPGGVQGAIDAFASGTTNLILDICGFFAP